MLPFYQSGKENEKLGEDDSLAINYLYSKSSYLIYDCLFVSKIIKSGQKSELMFKFLSTKPHNVAFMGITKLSCLDLIHEQDL